MKPPIEPVVWSPPPLSPRARRRTGAVPLPTLRRLPLPARGEDVAIDRQGRLIAGLEDGRVVRLDPDGRQLETLADTGGRPLGIEVAADGSLLVCDAKRGLLRVDPERKRSEVLVDALARDLRLCNNAAIARDGTIYFSDSSRHFGIEHWRGDLYEHSGTGRLLRRSPSGKVEVLLDGLEFANGVALAADESFVAVAETGAYRVARFWLTGPARGQSDLLCDGLPGFPDNLSRADDGLFWVAIGAPRNVVLDFLHRSHPLLRQLLWALPLALHPRAARTVCALAFDASGKLVHDLQGRARGFHMVTGLRAQGELLYLASLEERALAVLKIPKAAG